MLILGDADLLQAAMGCPCTASRAGQQCTSALVYKAELCLKNRKSKAARSLCCRLPGDEMCSMNTGHASA